MRNDAGLHPLKLRLVAKDGKLYHRVGKNLFLVEMYEGKYRYVKNEDRSGWWRFNDHYDRNGYCDNPARGY